MGSIELTTGVEEEKKELQERAKRWDHPFHNTVPSFPLPRKRLALWGNLDYGVAEGREEEAVGGKQGSGGGRRKGEVEGFFVLRVCLNFCGRVDL